MTRGRLFSLMVLLDAILRLTSADAQSARVVPPSAECGSTDVKVCITGLTSPPRRSPPRKPGCRTPDSPSRIQQAERWMYVRLRRAADTIDFDDFTIETGCQATIHGEFLAQELRRVQQPKLHLRGANVIGPLRLRDKQLESPTLLSIKELTIQDFQYEGPVTIDTVFLDEKSELHLQGSTFKKAATLIVHRAGTVDLSGSTFEDSATLNLGSFQAFLADGATFKKEANLQGLNRDGAQRSGEAHL